MVSQRTQTGLFDRTANLLELISKMPENISDEETQGVLRVLPPDVRQALSAFFIPSMRATSIVFLKMLGKCFIGAREAQKQGKKVILAPFNFPPELLHAFDSAFPLTSEVLSTVGVIALQGQGERYFNTALGFGLPDHICSANSIALGSILGGEDFRPDALISSAPGGCDVNSKIHEFVAHYLNIPQFFLQKPPDDSQRGRDCYVRYTKRMIRNLEEFLGEKLSEEKLRRVMEKANRCTELNNELWEMQKAKPSPLPNLYSLMLYGTRFTMWGTDAAIENLESMVATAKRRMKDPAFSKRPEKARTLWAYTSYYFDVLGLFNWMDDKGYAHLGDGLDLYFPQAVDCASMDTMIEGWARSAWNMPMTRQVGGESMSGAWTEDIVFAAGDLNADCVIFCGHHSCKQTWSVVSILGKELKKRLGLPILVLQGDSWLKNMTPIGAIQQQIEEFVTHALSRKKRSIKATSRIRDKRRKARGEAKS